MNISQKTKGLLALLVIMSMVMSVSAFAATGVVNVDLLNIRSAPSYDSSVVTMVGIGTSLDVVDGSDGWYTLNFDGSTAYAVAQYVDITDDTQASSEPVVSAEAQYYEEYWYAAVNAGTLNVRADASFDSRVVRTFYRGHKVEVRGEKGDFYIIENGEWDAYVAKEYISWISVEDYNAPSVSTGSQAVVDVARQYLGVPYVYGGSSPRGFDCSGFTKYVYSQMGVSINRTASGQASNGVWVSRSDLQPGDLLLFGPYSGGGIGHAGIYIGDGNMIHSPKPGRSVCIESINSSYYSSRYVQARRII